MNLPFVFTPLRLGDHVDEAAGGLLLSGFAKAFPPQPLHTLLPVSLNGDDARTEWEYPEIIETANAILWAHAPEDGYTLPRC